MSHVTRRLSRLDHRAFDTVAEARLPGFEHVLPRLSRAADHAVLWFGVAGAFAVTGRPALRRAALRGIVAIGLSSPTVNLVGKQLFQRRRPLIDLVPPIRVHRRIPISPAFPSGHSASAAAFATGVACEAPVVVTIPVAMLAAAVAGSRVYIGVHYPGDVLAGVGVGTAVGIATGLLWRVRRHRCDRVDRDRDERDRNGAVMPPRTGRDLGSPVTSGGDGRGGRGGEEVARRFGVPPSGSGTCIGQGGGRHGQRHRTRP